ncbi:MAG: hypothetical protein ABI977_27450 [Acidobacteriota bacterium]
MPSQELLPITLQREISRLSHINEELTLTIIARENTILARDATIAARDTQIAQLARHRQSLIWLVLVLLVMLIIAVATGR